MAVKFTEHYGQIITCLIVRIKKHSRENYPDYSAKKTILSTIIAKFKHIEPFFHEKAMHFRGRSLGD